MVVHNSIHEDRDTVLGEDLRTHTGHVCVKGHVRCDGEENMEIWKEEGERGEGGEVRE